MDEKLTNQIQNMFTKNQSRALIKELKGDFKQSERTPKNSEYLTLCRAKKKIKEFKKLLEFKEIEENLKRKVYKENDKRFK